MAVPYTFGTATAAIPLSQLDSNFASTITLGNTAIQLGNTVTTLYNMTLANVTISSGNVTVGTMRSTSVTIADTATITPPSDSTNQYTVTALAQAATVAIPSGTPIDGQKLIIRIKDNGTARALTWTTSAGGYRVIGTTLPTTTVISKTVYIGCIYNSTDVYWDVTAVAQQA